AVRIARDHFSCTANPTFIARLKLPGQATAGRENVTKANWTTLAPRTSILLIQASTTKPSLTVPAPHPNQTTKPSVGFSNPSATTHRHVQLPAVTSKKKTTKVTINMKYRNLVSKRYTVRASTLLNALFDVFAQSIGVNRNVIRFYYEDKKVDATKTVGMLWPGSLAAEAPIVTINAAAVLQLGVRGLGTTRYFATTSNKSLRVLENGWARANGVQSGEFNFQYKGKLLRLNLNADNYEMQTGDIIDVVA
ncbi:hypothetical protein FRB90_006728, partial [Tulasnella sp. 427]